MFSNNKSNLYLIVPRLFYRITEVLSFLTYRFHEYFFYKIVENFTGVRTLGKYFLPPIYPKQSLEYALNYKPTNGDKFIITYPKCGTTWTQYIVQLILNNGVPDTSKRDLIWDNYIEYRGEEVIKYPVIKTHLPFYYIPSHNKNVKFLCVIRNPKDSCVSMYNFVLYLAQQNRMPMIMDFHQHFMLWYSGHYFMGDYFDITKELWLQRYESNFTMLVYEQMRTDSRQSIIKIAKFLGDNYREKLLANNEDILQKVVKYSEFNHMKADNESYGGFFRKGTVGDWRNYFNRFESDLVDHKFHDTFSGTGLEHVWVEEMKWNDK